MNYNFTIYGRLPSLNEYTNWNRSRKGAIIGNSKKQKLQEMIGYSALEQLGTIQIKKPVSITYKWIEPNRRRDLDNIAFAKKFINDALVQFNILKGDGWKHIKSIQDRFEVDQENPRIEVTLIEIKRKST